MQLNVSTRTAKSVNGDLIRLSRGRLKTDATGESGVGVVAGDEGSEGAERAPGVNRQHSIERAAGCIHGH